MPRRPSKHPVRAVLRYTAWILVTALAIISAGLGVLSAADHLDAFPSNSLFYGFDYLSPLWLGTLAVPAAAGLAALGARRAGIWWLAAFAVYVAGFGDLSLRFLEWPASAHAGIAQEGPRIAIASANVRYYSYGAENVARGLRALDADVVLLSESRFRRAEDKRIERLLLPGRLLVGADQDAAILSWLPVLAFREVTLPSRQTRLDKPNEPGALESLPRRTLLHAIVDAHGTPVHVISLRLTAGRSPRGSLWEKLAWSRYLLKTQMEEVEIASRYIASLDGAVILGGDLNAPPRSKPLRRLRELADDAQYAAHLWGRRTFPSHFPYLRLDYLFGAQGAEPTEFERLDVRLSDHLPVRARFHVAQAAVWESLPPSERTSQR